MLVTVPGLERQAGLLDPVPPAHIARVRGIRARCRVGPHLRCQVLVLEVDTCVGHGNDHAGARRGPVPSSDPADVGTGDAGGAADQLTGVSEVPLTREFGIIGDRGGRHARSGRGYSDRAGRPYRLSERGGGRTRTRGLHDRPAAGEFVSHPQSEGRRERALRGVGDTGRIPQRDAGRHRLQLCDTSHGPCLRARRGDAARRRLLGLEDRGERAPRLPRCTGHRCDGGRQRARPGPDDRERHDRHQRDHQHSRDPDKHASLHAISFHCAPTRGRDPW